MFRVPLVVLYRGDVSELSTTKLIMLSEYIVLDGKYTKYLLLLL